MRTTQRDLWTTLELKILAQKLASDWLEISEMNIVESYLVYIG